MERGTDKNSGLLLPPFLEIPRLGGTELSPLPRAPRADGYLWSEL